MLVLVGHTRSYKNIALIQRQGFGRMMCQDKPQPFQGEQWGFDNGAYSAWINGEPFDERAYAIRLEAALGVGEPYMAIVPDLVAQGMDSLDYSLGWLAGLPHRWPWYLALQDGMSESAVGEVIELFNGLFLGGTDKFKGSAQRWCDLAHSRGKRFHYGRAGTLVKLQHAYNVGADSCDSAFPLWTEERTIKFCAFNNDMRRQMRFEPV